MADAFPPLLSMENVCGDVPSVTSAAPQNLSSAPVPARVTASSIYERRMIANVTSSGVRPFSENHHPSSHNQIALLATRGAAQPPPTLVENKSYIPYRYTVNEAEKSLRIFARSTCGTDRHVFSRRLEPWSYLILELGPDDDPDLVLHILRTEMSTEDVRFNPEMGVFLCQPTSNITKRVADACTKIIHVPITSYTALARLNHRFFDVLDSESVWIERSKTGASSHHKVFFQTIVWLMINENTIAFSRKRPAMDTQIIEIWTCQDILADANHASVAASNLTSMSKDKYANDSQEFSNEGLELAVRTFPSRDSLFREFPELLRKYADIAVHYGENENIGSIIHHTRQLFRSDYDCPLEIFNLRDYVEFMFPDIPTHSFNTIVSELSSQTQPLLDSRSAEMLFTNALARMCMDTLDIVPGNPQQQSSTESFIPDLRTLHPTPDNSIFCFEKISAKVYLLGKLSEMLMSQTAFELCYHSGCNLSSLTKPEFAARGIMTYINPIAAQTQMVLNLPHDEMKHGLHSMVHVTPYAHVLVDLLTESLDTTTQEVAKKMESLKQYWWVIRDLYSLRALAAPPPPDLPGVFGLYRGMMYSRCPVKSPVTGSEYPAARWWSAVIKVGLNSWIGISWPLPDSDPGSSPKFEFVGLAEVCRHPFPAVRSAVEMFLTLWITTGSQPAAAMIAASTGLTKENTVLTKRITSHNVATYRRLLNDTEIPSVESGKREITVQCWHVDSTCSFVANPLKSKDRVYRNEIERIITNTFRDLDIMPLHHATSPQPQTPAYQSEEDTYAPPHTTTHESVQPFDHPFLDSLSSTVPDFAPQSQSQSHHHHHSSDEHDEFENVDMPSISTLSDARRHRTSRHRVDSQELFSNSPDFKVHEARAKDSLFPDFQ